MCQQERAHRHCVTHSRPVDGSCQREMCQLDRGIVRLRLEAEQQRAEERIFETFADLVRGGLNEVDGTGGLADAARFFGRFGVFGYGGALR